MRIVTSASAAVRLDAARDFLRGQSPATELIIVGASRGAADDLARAIARQAGATFGITRFSLTELAARAAAAHPQGRRVPGTQAGAEAIAARAVFDALAAEELAYFEPVARMPGFPEGARADPARAAPRRHPHSRRTANAERRTSRQICSTCWPGSRRSWIESSVDDRAALFRLAAEACRSGQVRWATVPILLLDVPLDSRAEQEFVAALIEKSPEVLATVPDGDAFALDALAALGGTVEHPDISNVAASHF